MCPLGHADRTGVPLVTTLATTLAHQCDRIERPSGGLVEHRDGGGDPGLFGEQLAAHGVNLACGSCMLTASDLYGI